MKTKTKRTPLFVCQECGHRFMTVAAAERASFGDKGCPGCGGSDIDEGSWTAIDARLAAVLNASAELTCEDCIAGSPFANSHRHAGRNS